MRTAGEIIADLRSFHGGSDQTFFFDRIAEEIENHPAALQLINEILQLFERFPDYDFGTPGPLAHAIERFYRQGYEQELQRSLRRKPTCLTIWLANRIINLRDDNASILIDLLQELANRNDLPDSVRKSAQYFASRQALGELDYLGLGHF